MISVLFVANNSVYKTMTDSSGVPLDCWDEERDAMKWTGGNPIVAHPPCRLWCMLARFSSAPESEKELAWFALKQVREFGGVLEHPAFSKFFMTADLPRPGKRDEYGFTIGVEQHWFGHPSRKKTWVYVCGIGPKELPDIPLRMAHYQNVFTGHGRKAPAKRREFRSATPPAFARWLVETAERCVTKRTALCTPSRSADAAQVP